MHLFTAFDPHYTKIDEEAARITFERHFASSEAYDIYRDHRPGSTPPQLVSALETDGVFRWPAHRIAEARQQQKHSTHSYWFTFETPVFGGVLGSCHALDIPFALNNLDRKGVELLPATPPLDANSLHRSQIR